MQDDDDCKHSGIHPAPMEFNAAQIAADPVLQFFHYAHLPEKLRTTSAQFATLASFMLRTLPRNPERTVALRKLLEAKDAAVRANLPAPKLPKFEDKFDLASRPLEELREGEAREIGGHDVDRDGPIPFGG